MIDLHTHTTASDGRCTPSELVARASAAGVTVLSVTDHDTLAACAEAGAACAAAAIEFVPGIEVTAVREGVDVHTLGYFVDPASPSFAGFLSRQRQNRIDRVQLMLDRLRGLGIVLDANAILKPARDDASKSAGRPWIARALVDGGHVATPAEAFDRWLSRGRPAFVPRIAAEPETVITRIHEAGGLASIAHPGLVDRDVWLPQFADAGLDAIEAYHWNHDEPTTGRYVAMAQRLRLLVTGGSDFHADASHGGRVVGGVSLPRDAYEKLKARRRSA